MRVYPTIHPPAFNDVSYTSGVGFGISIDRPRRCSSVDMPFR